MEEFLAGDPAPSPTPAAPARLSHGPRVAPAKPPRALAGVRVMDFTWVWAGPQCCRLLADMGAEVIKIESDRRIDNYRTAPRPDGQPYGLNRAPGFLTMNRNKLSVRINLSCPEGREAALRLAALNVWLYRTSRRASRGLRCPGTTSPPSTPPSSCCRCRFGATGPDRDYVLYGNSQTALAGLGFAGGFPGGPPENIANAHGDPISAYHGAVAALSAVLSARRTGRGQHIDMSQWEAMTATVPDGVLDFAMSRRDRTARQRRHPHGPRFYYHCAVKSGRPARPDPTTGRLDRHRDRHRIHGGGRCAASWATRHGRLTRASPPRRAGWRAPPSWTATSRRGRRTRDAIALTRELRAAGVAAAPVTDIADIVADPLQGARGFFEEIDHAEAGRQAIGVPFPPVPGDAGHALAARALFGH
ncbi:MAG: CoA transferase [Dehalococcoidia bacterium]